MHTRNLQVVQVTMGRFNQFDLARQMVRLGLLRGFFTAYPKRKVADEGLPPHLVHSFPWVAAFNSLARRVAPSQVRLRSWLKWQTQETLDRFAAGRLPRCDVLIGQSGQGLHSGVAAQAMGAKYVCHRGSTHIRDYERRMAAEFHRWRCRYEPQAPRLVEKELREYETADLITVPSRAAREGYLSEGVDPTRVVVTSYGVDLTRFKPSGEPAAGQFQVIAVGQVILRKGIPDLLVAFSRLRHPRKRLQLVGRVGPEMKTAIEVNRLPTEHVHWVGEADLEEVRRLMSESHVLAMPSIEDGFGKVVLEAMACGCPVIASRESGGSEAIENGVDGFVVAAGDQEQILRSMQTLASDEAMRAKMAVAAATKVHEHLSWDQYGERVRRVLLDLTGRT